MKRGYWRLSCRGGLFVFLPAAILSFTSRLPCVYPYLTGKLVRFRQGCSSVSHGTVRKWCYNGVMRWVRMEGRARMRLTTIPIHQILSLAQQFCKERPSRKKKFGRPLTYPEYPILTPFCPKASLQTFLQANLKFCKGRIRQHPLPFHLALIGSRTWSKKGLRSFWGGAQKRGLYEWGKGMFWW